MRRWPWLMNLKLGTYAHYNARRRRATHPFYEIDDSQRLRHLYVLGKSGSGKSTTLTNWAIQDIRRGSGCLLIDPHGDDAEQFLTLIPPWRRRDVIYFNPAEFPISFNVLDGVPKERRALVASSIVDAVKTIWRMDNAPNVEMFVHASIAALLEAPGSTLLVLNYILDSPKYRNAVVRKIEDPVIRHFWKQTFDEHMTDREQRDRTLSTLNKIFTLIADPAIRHCIGQSTSAFNFSKILEYNKILIAALPQGELGLQKASIIGSFLLANFHVAALQRKQGDRQLFPVYLNEAHHFINETITEMLTGLRKFGVSICLSHQSLQQIADPRIRAAVLGSVGTLVCFRVGPDDADELARIFACDEPDGLLNLAPFRALVTDALEALRMPPITAKHWPSGPRKIRANCRTRYSRPITEIEAKIADFVAAAAPEKRGRHKPAASAEYGPTAWNG